MSTILAMGVCSGRASLLAPSMNFLINPVSSQNEEMICGSSAYTITCTDHTAGHVSLPSLRVHGGGTSIMHTHEG